MLTSILEMQQALARGETSSVQLTERSLERSLDSAGQGSLVFTSIYKDQAMAAAQASDRLRAAGLVRSPLEGLPVSVKDLFDVAGEPTCAGSKVLRNATAASADAVVVQHLRNAGAVITGKTNMVEFAYSGLGLNPHYGTPCSPWDKQARRIPGGSSSGAGVAVAESMSVASIGSDTGGSVRIPSAYCGLTGFKPTARRVSTVGALPLSTNLDSIGGLCASVSDCVVVDDIISGTNNTLKNSDWLQAALGYDSQRQVAGLRLLVPETLVFNSVDDIVMTAFNNAIERLKANGAQIISKPIPQFGQLAAINSKGGFTAAEAWAWHRGLLETNNAEYDPRVSSRIAKGKNMSAADYIDLLSSRQNWIKSVEQEIYGFDAVLMPTVPIVAPKIADLEQSDDLYFETNALVLRNPTLINFLDGCALSIPCHSRGTAPVGLMVAGAAMHDKTILGVGLAIETCLAASN